MNRVQFKKNVYQHFRIEPAMQMYESDGKLRGSLDDAWILIAADDKTFTLRNRASDHSIELGYDSYVGYTEDPGGKERHGTVGILVLKAQLYMHDGVLKFATTIAPGKELRDFTPPRTRKNVRDVIGARLSEQELATRRAEFAAGPWGAELLRTFQELPTVIAAFIAEIRAEHSNVMIRFSRYHGGYLLWAQGWYVNFEIRGVGAPGDAYLSVRKWLGCPTLPGLYVPFDDPKIRSEWRYQYGLARVDEAGWIDSRQPDAALTSREVIERIFTELFEHPNEGPPPDWRLPEG